MCHSLLQDARFFVLLLEIDRDQAAQTRAAGCARARQLLTQADFKWFKCLRVRHECSSYCRQPLARSSSQGGRHVAQ